MHDAAVLPNERGVYPMNAYTNTNLFFVGTIARVAIPFLVAALTFLIASSAYAEGESVKVASAASITIEEQAREMALERGVLAVLNEFGSSEVFASTVATEEAIEVANQRGVLAVLNEVGTSPFGSPSE